MSDLPNSGCYVDDSTSYTVGSIGWNRMGASGRIQHKNGAIMRTVIYKLRVYIGNANSWEN